MGVLSSPGTSPGVGAPGRHCSHAVPAPHRGPRVLSALLGAMATLWKRPAESIQDPQKRSHLVTLGSQPCNPRGQKCTEGAPTSFRPAAVTQGGGGASPADRAPRRLSHVPQSQPPTARGGPGLRNVTVMVGASCHPLGDSTGPWQDSQPDGALGLSHTWPLGLTLNARAPGEPGPGVQPPAERKAGALLQGQRSLSAPKVSPMKFGSGVFRIGQGPGGPRMASVALSEAAEGPRAVSPPLLLSLCDDAATGTRQAPARVLGLWVCSTERGHHGRD